MCMANNKIFISKLWKNVKELGYAFSLVKRFNNYHYEKTGFKLTFLLHLDMLLV